MAALIQLLFVPLMLLNLFGGIVSGIWLAVLGQWGTIGCGILAMFAPMFVFALALLPQMALAAPAAWFMSRGYRVPMYFFGALSLVYLYGLITVWAGAVLWFFMTRVHSEAALLPTLLWSYGAATAPWSYMASKESGPNPADGLGATITVLFLQVGYAVMMLMIVFGNPSFIDVMRAFAAVMILAVIASLTLVGVSSRYARA